MPSYELYFEDHDHDEVLLVNSFFRPLTREMCVGACVEASVRGAARPHLHGALAACGDFTLNGDGLSYATTVNGGNLTVTELQFITV